MRDKVIKRIKRADRALCIAAAAAGTVFIVLAAVSFPLVSVRYEVRTDKVTKPFRIVQISDLHSCAYGEDMGELVQLIDEAKPDVIALTGDIYDDKLDNANTRTLLSRIGERYTCCYVAGNHEWNEGADWAQIREDARSMGVQVLEGENITIGEVTICGSCITDDSDTWVDAVRRCANGTGDDTFNVLLVHFPESINYYRSYNKFDLILCGHAHGGQWRLPWTQNGLYTSSQGFFPKLSGGRFDYDDTTLIISRGLSRVKEPLPRIFNNPEFVVIDIIPE